MQLRSGKEYGYHLIKEFVYDYIKSHDYTVTILYNNLWKNHKISWLETAESIIALEKEGKLLYLADKSKFVTFDNINK